LLERVDARFLVLTAIEDGDGLPDTVDDGVLLRAVRMQNVRIEVLAAGLQINVLRLGLNDLTVRPRNKERFALAGVHRSQELPVSVLLLHDHVTTREIEPSVQEEQAVLLEHPARCAINHKTRLA